MYLHATFPRDGKTPPPPQIRHACPRSPRSCPHYSKASKRAAYAAPENGEQRTERPCGATGGIPEKPIKRETENGDRDQRRSHRAADEARSGSRPLAPLRFPIFSPDTIAVKRRAKKARTRLGLVRARVTHNDETQSKGAFSQRESCLLLCLTNERCKCDREMQKFSRLCHFSSYLPLFPVFALP